ncbi:DNA-deoxyinosine glycosylase [Alteromonadaceae bacterium M269]|nr:DNA-deoxyinosine glycosylase [Alteromonadaceae bacterium M269]
MDTITSFKPIAERSARILILGSMPGVASLDAEQYYAHPRNAFWPIMAQLFSFDLDLPYGDRAVKLKSSQVAVWDVLHSCVRPGSLDSDIETGTRVPNDFIRFFEQHPNIERVGFNGGEAEKSFNRYVLPTIEPEGMSFVRLPSTSPAHTMSLEKKIAAWKELLIT